MANPKNKRKWRKRIIWTIIIIFVLLLFSGRRLGLWGKPQTEQVTTEQPQVRDIVELISANGRVQPVTEVKISPEVSGEIVELPVDEGDYVQKGQLLIRIRPDTYVSAQERAAATVNSYRAQLEQTRAQLELARQTYERQKLLFEQSAIPATEFESAEAQYNGLLAQVRTAEFNINSAEASLKEAEENLYKTTIFAPASGTVSKLNVEIGERVVGTATMAGTEVMRIADLSQMEVRAEVNENDIVRVKLGDTTAIEIDAYMGRKFRGEVTRIANTAQDAAASADQVTNFEVRIYIFPDSYLDLEQSDVPSPFRPGMSATVDIQTDRQRLLAVPIQAVASRSEGGAGESREVVFVYRPETSTVEQMEVTTGIQDRQYIGILSGLDTSMQVVTAPFMAISRRLTDGQTVEKVEQLGAGPEK